MADELDRLDQLLAKQEQRIAQAIRDYLAIVRSEVVVRVITDLLERGRAEDAIAYLNTYVSRIGETIPRVWQDIGEDAMENLRTLLPAVAVGISFDVTFPRAAELIRENRLEFIRDFTESQRGAVRQALERSMMEGSGTEATARAFRDAVGLSPVQEAAVARYRFLLEQNSRDALDRVLRDRRFDRTVTNAIERNQPLTARQIDNMVNRYRARWLAKRAADIARTEAHDAFSAARLEALEQMVEQTGIERERIDRIWNVTRDDRLRDHHATMSGQRRKMGETFEDGKGNQLRRPGDRNAPADTVINCRCTETFEILPAA